MLPEPADIHRWRAGGRTGRDGGGRAERLNDTGTVLPDSEILEVRERLVGVGVRIDAEDHSYAAERERRGLLTAVRPDRLCLELFRLRLDE